jgi:hypothetical protein
MVLPTASEGLANAWVEALACGTPLVITDVGGARELITCDTAGRLVARDPEGGGKQARASCPTRPARGRGRLTDSSAGMPTPPRWRALRVAGGYSGLPRSARVGSGLPARDLFLPSAAVSRGTKLSEVTPSQIRIGPAM